MAQKATPAAPAPTARKERFFKLNDTVAAAADLTWTEKGILSIIRGHIGKNGFAWLSQPALAKAANVTVRTVRRAVKKLKAAGYITVGRVDGYDSNTYRLTPKATVISEQKPQPGAIAPPPDNLSAPPGQSASIAPGQNVPLIDQVLDSLKDHGPQAADSVSCSHGQGNNGELDTIATLYAEAKQQQPGLPDLGSVKGWSKAIRKPKPSRIDLYRVADFIAGFDLWKSKGGKWGSGWVLNAFRARQREQLKAQEAHAAAEKKANAATPSGDVGKAVAALAETMAARDEAEDMKQGFDALSPAEQQRRCRAAGSKALARALWWEEIQRPAPEENCAPAGKLHITVGADLVTPAAEPAQPKLQVVNVA